jgi:hypothetical protein
MDRICLHLHKTTQHYSRALKQSGELTKRVCAQLQRVAMLSPLKLRFGGGLRRRRNGQLCFTCDPPYNDRVMQSRPCTRGAARYSQPRSLSACNKSCAAFRPIARAVRLHKRHEPPPQTRMRCGTLARIRAINARYPALQPAAAQARRARTFRADKSFRQCACTKAAR